MGRKRKRKRKPRKGSQSSKPLTPELKTKIQQWAEEAAEVHGYSLWDVETTVHGKWIVRLFIDRDESEPGQGINVDECAEVSRYMEAIFDAEEAVPEVYVLEVSSPGIERPLTKPHHLDRVVGEEVELVLRQPVAGKKKVVARLNSHDEGELVIEFNDETFAVAWDDVARAKLKFDFSNASKKQ